MIHNKKQIKEMFSFYFAYDFKPEVCFVIKINKNKINTKLTSKTV